MSEFDLAAGVLAAAGKWRDCDRVPGEGARGSHIVRLVSRVRGADAGDAEVWRAAMLCEPQGWRPMFMVIEPLVGPEASLDGDLCRACRDGLVLAVEERFEAVAAVKRRVRRKVRT